MILQGYQSPSPCAHSDAPAALHLDFAAWRYRLGSRSALEWVLDQYKEKNPRDPTILTRFNNYRLSDHKEHVIDLLRRVCSVSVRTMELVDGMARIDDTQRDVGAIRMERPQ